MKEKLKEPGISIFQRYLTLWVLLCMVLGVLIGKYPHRDLIALQVHWLHLPAILCRAGGRFDLPPPGTGAIMIDITVERERNQQT